MRFQGKTALVTGGASGIGQATVRRLAEEGATVIAADIDQAGLEETASGLDAVSTLAIDVSDSSSVNAAFDRVREEHGTLDVLVNAAGVAGPRGEVTPGAHFLTDVTDEEWDFVLGINLTGSFYCLRAAVPLLRAAGGGAVVNIASVSALVGYPLNIYYPASKSGVLGLTRAAAGGLAEDNIRVNVVCPGAIDTPMLRSIPEPAFSEVLALAPQNRAASPHELAGTILFLASDDAAFYTGQTLSPNGGMWM
jgi:NAD(P)-dependent dehydrogenase (short-subunit alcohol dehydrogenase family)